jgi:hypothetical protein
MILRKWSKETEEYLKIYAHVLAIATSVERAKILIGTCDFILLSRLPLFWLCEWMQGRRRIGVLRNAKLRRTLFSRTT